MVMLTDRPDMTIAVLDVQEWLLSVTSETNVHEVLDNCLVKLDQEKVW